MKIWEKIKIWQIDQIFVSKLQHCFLGPAGYFWRPNHITCRWGALQVIYLAGNICWQSGQKLRRKIDHKSENFEKSVNSNQKWLEVYWARYQNTSMHTLNMLWLFSCAEKIHGKENTWWQKKINHEILRKNEYF